MSDDFAVFKSGACYLAIFKVPFDAEPFAVEHFSGDTCGSAADEGIKNDVVFTTAESNEITYKFNGLNGWMDVESFCVSSFG